MTSFGWKRKAGGKICKSTAEAFSAEAKEEETEIDDIDWLTLTPKRRAISLEDAISKSERLKGEGAVLAEAERYWEAITKWDEAISLTPHNEKIVEMKAQALMAVGEVFPAVQAAEKTIKLSPTWWVGYQTLGRALANIGEVRMALKSFSRAVHLNPGDKELWVEDLLWTKSLLERKDMAVSQNQAESSVTITEISDNDSESDSNEKDQALVQYSASNSEGSSDVKPQGNENSHPKKMTRLPRNYIQMRDST